MAKHPKPADDGMVENDFCDLDPAKVCDNCCKCIEKSDADYASVRAEFDLRSMRAYYAEDEDDGEEAGKSDLAPMDIGSDLLAEWEARLREEELIEMAGDTPAHDPAHMHGRRKRRGGE